MMNFRRTGKATTTNVYAMKYFLRRNALFLPPPLRCVSLCCFLNGLPSHGYWKQREQNLSLFTGNEVKELEQETKNWTLPSAKIKDGGREGERSSSPRAKWQPCHVTGMTWGRGKADILWRRDHQRQRLHQGQGMNSAWPGGPNVLGLFRGIMKRITLAGN